jgi:hypothetical protein
MVVLQLEYVVYAGNVSPVSVILVSMVERLEDLNHIVSPLEEHVACRPLHHLDTCLPRLLHHHVAHMIYT